MIEQMQGYIVVTACFFLLFLVITFLVDRYRIQIQSFFTKHSRLSTKIPWNKVIKIGFAWEDGGQVNKRILFPSCNLVPAVVKDKWRQ